MAYLTKSEFSKLCGVETKYLSVMIARGNVVLDDDVMIDTDHERNILFLERRRSGPKPPKPPAPPKVVREKRPDNISVPRKPKIVQEPINETDEEQEEIDESGIPSLLTSEKKLKHLDAIKRSKDIEKLELDIQKKRGEVIPAALVLPVLLRQNMSLVTAFKNACDTILTKYTKIRELDVNEVADIRGFFLTAINEGSDKACIESEKSIMSIISEYSDKKGIGERS